MADAQRAMLKKRRPSKAEEEDDGKKRGRPRVEKNDESAADRRRTQIRMAQRAYRQRKESTLEELRKRVNELNGIVESMDAVFQDCLQRLIPIGLPEAAVNELKMTAARFTGLKTASQARELDNSDDGLVERPTPETVTPVPQADDALTPKNVSIWLDQTELGRNARMLTSEDYVGLGYTYMPSGLTDDTAYPFRTQKTAANMPGGSAPQQPISKSLEPIRTYSFQETTFGRRVHRACLEAGYSLLLDPSRNPQTFERVFRLPLLARDRTELIACTKACLDRGTTGTLDLYEAPLIHVGGAGTHYARRNSSGNMQQRHTAGYNLGRVGPSTLKLLMQADEQKLRADMAVEIEGFEGQWFDPYDVEGYLNEKGIFIEPSASFVEVEVAADMRALGDRSTMSSRAGTPGLTNSSDGVLSEPMDAYDLNAMPWVPSPEAMSDTVGFSASQAWMNPSQARKASTTTPQHVEIAKKTVMVDVTKLVKGLMTSAVCLGQTPGFRRQDVDKALAYACFDLY